jgi:hypothetical protein
MYVAYYCAVVDANKQWIRCMLVAQSNMRTTKQTHKIFYSYFGFYCNAFTTLDIHDFFGFSLPVFSNTTCKQTHIG